MPRLESGASTFLKENSQRTCTANKQRHKDDYPNKVLLMRQGHRRLMGTIPPSHRKGRHGRRVRLAPALIACLSKIDRRDAMDELGLNRYCCRRMVMTHVDLIEKLLR